MLRCRCPSMQTARAPAVQPGHISRDVAAVLIVLDLQISCGAIGPDGCSPQAARTHTAARWPHARHASGHSPKNPACDNDKPCAAPPRAPWPNQHVRLHASKRLICSGQTAPNDVLPFTSFGRLDGGDAQPGMPIFHLLKGQLKDCWKRCSAMPHFAKHAGRHGQRHGGRHPRKYAPHIMHNLRNESPRLKLVTAGWFVAQSCSRPTAQPVLVQCPPSGRALCAALAGADIWPAHKQRPRHLAHLLQPSRPSGHWQHA